MNKMFIKAKEIFDNQNIVALCNIDHRVEEVMELENIQLEIMDNVLNGEAKINCISHIALNKINIHRENLCFTLIKDKIKLNCYLEDFRDIVEYEDIFFEVLNIEEC